MPPRDARSDPSKEPLSKIVQARVTEKTHERLMAEADRRDTPLAEIVREILDKALPKS